MFSVHCFWPSHPIILQFLCQIIWSFLSCLIYGKDPNLLSSVFSSRGEGHEQGSMSLVFSNPSHEVCIPHWEPKYHGWWASQKIIIILFRYGFVTFSSSEDVQSVFNHGPIYFHGNRLNIGPAVRKQVCTIFVLQIVSWKLKFKILKRLINLYTYGSICTLFN